MSVFANGLEISGKAVQAQTIAAFPDVCFTPPQTPATPPGVPIPYPSFGMAADTEKGTSTVKIKGKTVNIKNKSDLKRTSGTEAGCAPKKGVITSKNMGKEYFNSWSNDVKMDGEPVIRMSDLATNNHASPSGNTPPWVHVAGVNYSRADCAKILADFGLSVHKHEDKQDACDWKSTKRESDHCPQATCFTTGTRHDSGMTFPKGQYDINKAPCVCMEDGTRLSTEHGKKSEFQRWRATTWQKRKAKDPSWNPTYKDAMNMNLHGIRYAKSPALNPDEDGNPHPALECLRAELDAYFKDELGMDDDTPVAIPDQKYVGKKYKARARKFRAPLTSPRS